ncbi:MAG: hypothetical protein KJO07_23800, partial [Deltaproteobacteria bacterium]|nr:hypothetical protein [Deltaproteobacteria bacterium]
MSARPLALAAVALAAGCSISSGDYFGIVGEPKPGHLRWCNSGEPEYLDPALVTSTTGVPIVEVLFDGLAVHGPSAEPVPGLAESWEIGPQLRRFTFQLRKGARWSNRREIVASDFRYHIVRILHPTTASRNAESHWNLKGGELFTAGRIKQLLEPVGGLSVGTAVEVFGWQPPAGAKGELFEEADEWKLRKDIELTASPGSGSVVARANKGVTVEVVALDGKYAQVRHRGKSGWATQKAVGVPLPDSNVRTSGSKLALRDFGRPAADAYATVEAGARVTVIERREGMSYVFHPEGDGVYG